jgi:hypothetical protein
MARTRTQNQEAGAQGGQITVAPDGSMTIRDAAAIMGDRQAQGRIVDLEMTAKLIVDRELSGFFTVRGELSMQKIRITD